MSKIQNGFYSAVYLLKTAKILKIEKNDLITEVQFFQRDNDIILCGIKHTLELLKKSSYDYKSLKILSLKDGDLTNKNEPVLKIIGNLWKFIHLEGIIDGILTRESNIATKTRRIINIIGSEKLIYMNDRSDYYFTQEFDGYAAYIGGVRNFVTESQISSLTEKKDIKLIGTIPHSLIQSYAGDLIKSLDAYSKHIDSNKLVGLVDYNNDVIAESLNIAKKFNKKLFAVRVDTSLELIDKTLQIKYLKNSKYNKNDLKGVNYILANELRNNLDKNNFNHVKIIFSSGLNEEKISYLISKKAPIDFYGVGSYFLQNNINFTCDAVKLNNLNEAKFGRKNIENRRLRLIKND